MIFNQTSGGFEGPGILSQIETGVNLKMKHNFGSCGINIGNNKNIGQTNTFSTQLSFCYQYTS